MRHENPEGTRASRDGSRPGGQRGAALAEILVAVALGATMAAVAVPGLGVARRRAALGRACTHVGTLMLAGRARAVLRRQTEALVFERRPGGWRCFLAEDGDDDGVRHDDLRRGRDRYVSEVLELEAGDAGLGLLRGVRIPDPGGRGWLGGDPGDPVRAGRGDIITFTRFGTATPASVYFTDGRDRMMVLRVLGATGRVRRLEWRRGWPSWRPGG